MHLPKPSRRPRLLAALVAVLVLAGCGSGSSSTGAAHRSPTSTTPSASSSQEPAPAIVGRWGQLHTCPHLVRAFRAAGLGRLAAVQAAGFGPDRPDSEMPTPQQLEARAARLRKGGDLCAHAPAPFRHFHFFTASGSFGSLDENLQQVDDGHYVVSGDDLVFGKNRFRYHVTGGDTLTLTPLLTARDRRQALAHPLAFTDATWMVSVAYTGSTWRRVPCDGWC